MADIDNGEKVKDIITPHSLVTEEHVLSALKADKGNDAKLTSWSVVDFTKPGDNFACVVSSVEVNFTLNNHDSKVVYIVKLNPCRDIKEFIEMTADIFIKEANFYLKLLPDLNSALKDIGEKPLNFAKCFHGGLEPKKEIIFLEDLRPRGFQMFDRRKGLDLAHTTLVMKELAKLHATSILLQNKTPNFIKTYDFLKFDLMLQDMMTSVLEKEINSSIEILQRIGSYDRVIEWLRTLIPKVSDILKEGLGESKYNVVCHGDCWNNNMLFKYDDNGNPLEAVLLDLQINRYASPATDLNYLLYTSLTGEVRKPHLDTFLNIYHDTFTGIMEAAGNDTIFTRQQLKQEFRDKNIIGVVFAAMIIPFLVMEADEVPDINKAEGTLDEFMNVLKEKTLENLDTNLLLRPRFLAVFDEMLESGLIS